MIARAVNALQHVGVTRLQIIAINDQLSKTRNFLLSYLSGSLTYVNISYSAIKINVVSISLLANTNECHSVLKAFSGMSTLKH